MRWYSDLPNLSSLTLAYRSIFSFKYSRFYCLFIFSVDGRWSGWSSWSPCSVTCGNGRQERMRKCDAPVPEFGGKFCDGPAREFHNCEEDDCPGKLILTGLLTMHRSESVWKYKSRPLLSPHASRHILA